MIRINKVYRYPQNLCTPEQIKLITKQPTKSEKPLSTPVARLPQHLYNHRRLSRSTSNRNQSSADSNEAAVYGPDRPDDGWPGPAGPSPTPRIADSSPGRKMAE